MVEDVLATRARRRPGQSPKHDLAREIKPPAGRRGGAPCCAAGADFVFTGGIC